MASSIKERVQSSASDQATAVFGTLFGCMLLGVAVFALIGRTDLDLEMKAGLFLTLTLTLLATGGLTSELLRGEAPQIETHWGGFGGGGGGWRISPAAVYLVAMLGFGAMSTSLLLGVQKDRRSVPPSPTTTSASTGGARADSLASDTTRPASAADTTHSTNRR